MRIVPIGSQFSLDRPPAFDLEIVGTEELEQIELWRGNELLHSWPAIQERSPDQLRLSWKGARVRGRARKARWDGTLTVEGGRILAVENYAFDSPAEGVQDWDPNRVSWRSITTGDTDGILVTLEAQADTLLAVDTPLVSTEISWSDLGDSSKRIAAGGVNLELTIERCPIGLKERYFRINFRPASSPSGEHAYWIAYSRVTERKRGQVPGMLPTKAQGWRRRAFAPLGLMRSAITVVSKM